MAARELTIDPEFDGLLPRMSEFQLSQLTANLESEGWRSHESIVVWANNDDTIIDGHNRYRICQELGIDFKTKSLVFPDRDAVKEWIYTNQWGRRNWTSDQESFARGEVYNLRKKRRGEHAGNQHTNLEKDQSDPIPTTAETLAKEFGVSPGTIKRDAKFADAVEGITATLGVEARQQILSADCKASRTDIIEISGLATNRQAKALRDAMSGKKRTKYIPVAPDYGRGFVKDLADLSGQKFGTIYADPPWQYDNSGTRANSRGEYKATMSVADIAAMPIGDFAADDAHLHLWTTNSFVFEAKKIMDAWGFEYKSMFVWVKPQMGIGNYWRVSHELLLLGVKGDAKRFTDHSHKSWAEFPRRDHSEKPEEVRHIIEQVSSGPFLELFGRKDVEGWKVYGNEKEPRLIPA